MIIIGITGTLGAGKGAVVSYLVKRGFKHFSARSFLAAEVERRGMRVNRDTMTQTADSLRREHGPSYIAMALYTEAEASGKNAIIESIRTPHEAEYLRARSSFRLLSVDADPKVRYERAIFRNSDLDHVSFEKFLLDEKREMGSDDPTRGNIGECMRIADVHIQNDGTLAELNVALDAALEKLAIKA